MKCSGWSIDCVRLAKGWKKYGHTVPISVESGLNMPIIIVFSNEQKLQVVKRWLIQWRRRIGDVRKKISHVNFALFKRIEIDSLQTKSETNVHEPIADGFWIFERTFCWWYWHIWKQIPDSTERGGSVMLNYQYGINVNYCCWEGVCVCSTTHSIYHVAYVFMFD